MLQTIILSFLGGVMGGNALPHFLRGITKRRYPNLTGNGPIPNLVAGWGGLVIAVLLLHWAHGDRHLAWSFSVAALGVLAIGLFHAGPGAFGRPEPTPAGAGTE